MSGKGSSPRPIPNRQQYEDNFDAIFGKSKAAPLNTPSTLADTKPVKCEHCGQFWSTDTLSKNHCICPSDIH